MTNTLIYDPAARFNRHVLFELMIARDWDLTRTALVTKLSLGCIWNLLMGKTNRATSRTLHKLEAGFGVPAATFLVQPQASQADSIDLDAIRPKKKSRKNGTA